MTIQEEGATEVDSDDTGGIDAADYTSGGLIVLSICLGKCGLFNSVCSRKSISKLSTIVFISGNKLFSMYRGHDVFKSVSLASAV